MLSRSVVFWEVDPQADFMLPGGKLYVPGAERLLPNIRRLTDAARQGRVFLVSHGCYHTQDDPEFQTFPPHCIKGTPGSAFVPEALTDKVLTIPNDAQAVIPHDLSPYQQVLLEKQTLDIFRKPPRRKVFTAIRGRRSIRGIRRGHGILRALCRQRIAGPWPSRISSAGCNRNLECRKWTAGYFRTPGSGSKVLQYQRSPRPA